MNKLGPTLLAGLLIATSISATVRGQDKLPYQDASLPVAQRVDDLIGRMTLDEKIGQMTQVEKNSIKAGDIGSLGIGSLLSGGGGYPATGNTPENWAAMVDGYQKEAMSSRLAIPMIYGVDAVHGHAAVKGATVFPQNVSLGAANDTELVERIGRATAQEMIATGIYWDFAPVVAVVQDVRWGRTYESYGENTELVTKLSSAYIKGLQGDSIGTPGSVLATPKHFVGDGGTKWGSSKTDSYRIDQGVTDVDEATLRAIHLPPYEAAIKAGAKSIMISFSSWGGMKMHAQKYLITDVLKGELGFTGFIISDWAGMDQITKDYPTAMITGINAGVDMNMVPYDYHKFIDTMKQAIADGKITTERVDDAVRRILTVKFEMGLFEHPYSDPNLLPSVGSEEHRAIAREAVSKSLVLLKNDNQTLPIAKDTPTIFVGGVGADDIGMQSGGWTIEWQGKTGNITPGMTILDGIKAQVSDKAKVVYDKFARFRNEKDANGNPTIADIGIMVIGEQPYAEGRGDSPDLLLLDNISLIRERSKKLVIVVLSGRPVNITAQLKVADAVVAAWLPGTEGDGVTDVLFGDKSFTGKLAFTWPRSAEQLPFNFATLAKTGCDAPLFPFGYGLDTTTSTTFEDSCK